MSPPLAVVYPSQSEGDQQKALSKKILVVDDDLAIIDALEELLKYSGYDVQSTPNAEEVYDRIASYQPDLILLDVMLSGTDGRDICRQLKNSTATSTIPVIMVSATPSISQTILEVGANDFVPKPFDIFSLIQKIERQLTA